MTATRIIFLVVLMLPSLAHDAIASKAPMAAAVNRDFGEKSYIWVSKGGDLNGDGIEDVAAIVVQQPSAGRRKETLAVYAGNLEGALELISKSGQYCEARHWYNLHIARGSLFVEAVATISTTVTTITLQYRHDVSRNDFRIVGKEYRSHHFDDDDSFRGSVNHLTGAALYSRANARGRKEIERTFELPETWLSGFDCGTWEHSRGQHVYINERLKVSD